MVESMMLLCEAGADLGGGGSVGRPLLRDSTPCRPKGSPFVLFTEISIFGDGI